MGQAMALRDQFTEQLKAAMKAGDAARTSTLRMVIAKMKEADIAARPRGVAQVEDADIIGLLRGMVKSRREAAELYRQGNRPELAAKEEGEIAVIETFLPAALEGAALERAVEAAIAAAGATGPREMGKVMAALKAAHGAALDMAAAGAVVKAKLAG